MKKVIILIIFIINYCFAYNAMPYFLMTNTVFQIQRNIAASRVTSENITKNVQIKNQGGK